MSDRSITTQRPVYLYSTLLCESFLSIQKSVNKYLETNVNKKLN